MLEYVSMLNFYTKISIKDFISLCSINKHIFNNYYNDEIIWEYYCRKKFSDNFWNIAQKHPEFTWKLCLNNILKFESQVMNIKYTLWTEENYFLFWNFKGW